MLNYYSGTVCLWLFAMLPVTAKPLSLNGTNLAIAPKLTPFVIALSDTSNIVRKKARSEDFSGIEEDRCVMFSVNTGSLKLVAFRVQLWHVDDALPYLTYSHIEWHPNDSSGPWIDARPKQKIDSLIAQICSLSGVCKCDSLENRSDSSQLLVCDDKNHYLPKCSGSTNTFDPKNPPF